MLTMFCWSVMYTIASRRSNSLAIASLPINYRFTRTLPHKPTISLLSSKRCRTLSHYQVLPLSSPAIQQYLCTSESCNLRELLLQATSFHRNFTLDSTLGVNTLDPRPGVVTEGTRELEGGTPRLLRGSFRRKSVPRRVDRPGMRPLDSLVVKENIPVLLLRPYSKGVLY